MDKKLIAKLVAGSVTNGHIDEKKALAFTEKLDRKQLKMYINQLRKWVRRNTVIIESAREVNRNVKDEFRTLYGEKSVVFVTNPDLLIGIRITDNDTIYEMNLENSLENIKEYITQ